jgi:hypothetical protein
VFAIPMVWFEGELVICDLLGKSWLEHPHFER